MTKKKAAQTLGISLNASVKKARAAYRRLMMKHHPDRGGDEETAKRLTSAWRVFSDAAKSNADTESDEDVRSELFDVVWKDDADSIRALAAGLDGAMLRMRDEKGYSLMHVAAMCNACMSIAALVKLGVDINAKTDGLDDMSIHLAVRCGCDKAAILLAQLGADVNAKTALGEDIIYIPGDDPWFGYTPLHLAARTSDSRDTISVASALIGHGADINIQDYRGETPLQLALKLGYGKWGRNFVQKCEMRARAKHKGGPTPLHLVVRDLEIGAIPDFIKIGGNVNAQDEDGNTPLHWAVMQFARELITGDLKRRMSDLEHNRDVCEIIDFLVKLGANVNARNSDGREPIHMAAQKAREAIDVLVKHGASVNARDNGGMTPMHHAVMEDSPPHHYPDGTRILLAHLARMGADVNARDSGGSAPLDLAAANTDSGGAGWGELHRRGGKSGKDLPDPLSGRK